MNSKEWKELQCKVAAQNLEAYYDRRRGKPDLPNAEISLIKVFMECCGEEAWQGGLR